jgi:hypothetical protein
LIAESISNAQVDKKRKKSLATKSKKISKKGMSAFLDNLGHRLPSNYKFNREEANER